MVTINLLPWRIKAARYQHRVVKRLVAFTLLCSLLLVMVIYVVVLQSVHVRRAHVSELQRKISRFSVTPEQSTVNETVLNHIRNALQQTSLIMNWLLILAKVNYVCFNELRWHHQHLLITGQTFSLAAIQALLSEWKTNQIIDDALIEEVNRKGGSLQFRLRATPSMANAVIPS